MPSSPVKGRGAASRTRNRFEKTSVEPDPEAGIFEPAPQTELRPMRARRIISSNASPDVPFERSINPYLGCEHGCIYCYARPSHSYLDLSPGLDFESKIFFKPNAIEALLAEWEKPDYVVKPITIGANTDPYQPAEKRLGITRQLLEAFLRHRHPVSLISKGTLMQRDLGLLAQLADQNLASVAISIPTIDMALKRKLEPRVPSAEARFRLLRDLHGAGVPTSLLLAPVIPAINDAEIESILGHAADCGVQHAAYILLRLPHELKQIFAEWLELHLPDRAGHVMSLLRQARGGREYENRFGLRQSGRGPYADMIAQRFRNACRRYRLGHGETSAYDRQTLDCSRFRKPGAAQESFAFGA
jgi:DNA repair photolyase